MLGYRGPVPMRPVPLKMVYADGPDAAVSDPRSIAALLGHRGPIDLRLGWTTEQPPWLDDPEISGLTYMAGFGLSAAVRSGRFQPLPVRLSAVPGRVEAFAPDVAVIGGVRRGAEYALATSVGWAPTAARVARQVVVEILADDDDFGGPMIEGDVVATVERPGVATASAGQRAGDAIDLSIGRLVASMLPTHGQIPTLQFGPGGIGQGIADALERPVHIWSGLITDAVAGLDERGLLASPAVGAYTWGGAPIRRLFQRGMLRLEPVTVTHDLTRMTAMSDFVACNTAVQIGIDGSVNLERVGGRVISSVGGHADFCTAASRSATGLAVIAVRSTTARGDSTIVARVDAVSTSAQ